MSLIDDEECPLCGGDCVPWRCGNCGASACSHHEENCPDCGFPRLHRFRDLERRAKLREEVDQIFGQWQNREGA